MAKLATAEPEHDVIIVGGGPVGLFLALSLARKGIQTIVLEAEADIIQSPRAIGHYPVVLHEFDRIGLLEEVVQAGHKNQEGFCFRTLATGTNKVLAQIPTGTAPKGSIAYAVQVGQHKLSEIFRRHAMQCPSFSLEYNTRFVGLDQEADGVTAHTINPDGKKRTFRARFLIGCDGASSAVRKNLEIPFDGYTWDDWRFLAINIKYDFAKHGYSSVNHVLDPRDWAVVVRASNAKEDLWRIATGIDPSIPVDDIDKHIPAKLEKLLPGPRPLKYELAAVSPYWAHERVAETFHKGRVVLCGDAAHVNNPLTAMGLTTGFLDAAVLSRLVLKNLLPGPPTTSHVKVFGQYTTLRKSDFVGRVQKLCVAGKLRLHSTDPKVVAEKEDFFNMLNKNPGFAEFVAGTLMETLPDELFPGIGTRFLLAVGKVLRTIRTVVLMIYWKINASIK